MASEPLSALDLSAGSEPPGKDLKKANQLLDDAASRRRYRLLSVVVTVVVVLFLCLLLYRIVCAITLNISYFSAWIVGIFATGVIAVTVLTLALLRATFASPVVESDTPDMSAPQLSIAAELLKALGGAIEGLGKTVGKG